MASKFQSRLIGTVILVAIGVIVLPDVFDGKKEHYKEEFAAIPIKPTNDANQTGSAIEVKQPVELDVALPDEPVSATVEPDPKTQQVAEKPVPKRETNQYADSAWIIQLAALSNKENAQKLVADLRKRGFQAHLKPDGNLSRVIVGPDVSREKMEQQINELQKITGLKGQLQTFKPLN